MRPAIYPANFKWRNTTTRGRRVWDCVCVCMYVNGRSCRQRLRKYTVEQLVHILPRTAANAISRPDRYIGPVCAAADRERYARAAAHTAAEMRTCVDASEVMSICMEDVSGLRYRARREMITIQITIPSPPPPPPRPNRWR